MNKALTPTQLLKSKTFWTIVGTGALNVWQQVQGDPSLALSPNIMAIINTVLSVLAIVFRAMNTQTPPA